MSTCAATRAELSNRALALSWFTVLFNIAEGVVAVTFGLLAGSISLVGFGLDSFIESLSGGVMIWRFTLGRRLDCAAEERIEARAARLVAVTFFALGAYVAWEAAGALLRREAPEASPAGIVIALVSLAVMPLLFVLKQRAGRALDSRSLLADSKQTLICMLLSVTLLLGLALNYRLGWWWADPAAALAIAALLLREGFSTWRSGELCAC